MRMSPYHAILMHSKFTLPLSFLCSLQQRWISPQDSIDRVQLRQAALLPAIYTIVTIFSARQSRHSAASTLLRVYRHNRIR
mmetsp:Transcript_5891/g.15989  ORF Transcript_5891/g.15989 Transcript_5891/m.15989 type:complete len:81 (+) Transcript_5891:115-357(+)